jgi:pimeloyl-ACP methyl ester carboxylesterase
MIDARGTLEPQGVSLMFQIALQRILASNYSVTSHSVVYPASVDQNVADIIQYGLEDCPDQKYFLFGYSQGATVVQTALNKLDNESLTAVSSVVMVGNPYRIPGRLSNVDSQGRLDNRTTFGSFATESLKANESVLTYNEKLDRSGKVSDICLEVSARQVYQEALSKHYFKGDVVCTFDPQCRCELPSDHLSYGLVDSVQDLIYKHVTSRF